MTEETNPPLDAQQVKKEELDNLKKLQAHPEPLTEGIPILQNAAHHIYDAAKAEGKQNDPLAKMTDVLQRTLSLVKVQSEEDKIKAEREAAKALQASGGVQLSARNASYASSTSPIAPQSEATSKPAAPVSSKPAAKPE